MSSELKLLTLSGSMRLADVFLCLVLVGLAVLPATESFPFFLSSMPNGNSVPHPCSPGQRWGGVGHLLPQGGGSRNTFGNDFAANSYRWTRSLCQKDSDGDGLTNGQELGDPACRFTRGQNLPVTSRLSHPGVCEPIDNPTCIARNMAAGYPANICTL